MVGHVGDGNFHIFFPADHSNTDELKRIEEVSREMCL